MSYDEKLAERIRTNLKLKRGMVEKKIFGGVGFMFQGNMACGVQKQDMIIRMSDSDFEKALKNRHARIFDTMGKPMKGWVLVDPEGCRSDKDLQSWIDMGLNFAKSLPAK